MEKPIIAYVTITVFKMVEVLVLYYSRGGRTEAMAKAVAEGAQGVEGVTALLRRVDYSNIYDLITCDAVAFGSPNYFGYMAGLVKDFFDRALAVREKISSKPAAAFTSGGGANDSALLSLERMITSFRLEKVADGVACSGVPSEKDLATCKKMGEELGKAACSRAKSPVE